MTQAAVMEPPTRQMQTEQQTTMTTATMTAPGRPTSKSETSHNLAVSRTALLRWSGLDGSTEVEASDLFAPEFRCLGPARDAFGRVPRSQPGCSLGEAFSDRDVEIRRMVAQGDRVVTYLRFRGRHTGEFQGRPPSGRQMQADGYVVHRFRGGRIAEEWSVLRWR